MGGLFLRLPGGIRRFVRRFAIVSLIIAWLGGQAVAGPDSPNPDHPDPAAAPVATDTSGGTGSGGTGSGSGSGSPWIDLAPHSDPAAAPASATPANEPPLVAVPAEPERDEYHPVAAKWTMAAMYTAFAGWMYVAWYQHHKDLSQYKFGGDNEKCFGRVSWDALVHTPWCELFAWGGSRTYAGAADKFGHAWSTMSLARLGTEMLTQWGGYDRWHSTLVSTALSELLFIGVEVRDGFFFEFSYSDLGGDTVGALIALAMARWPKLDEMFDYRVEYWPSQMYLRKLEGTSPCPVGGCSRWNIAEDYSGETYLLAYHLGSIKPLREMKYGTIARFVDVVGGFGSRNYKPEPDPDLHAKPVQQMFIGLSFNAQGFFDWLLEDRPSTAAHRGRKVLHGLFEVFNLPGTSFRVLEHDHHANGPVNVDGA